MEQDVKRKPTRRDLLIVIGRLQRLIGFAKGANNDRNQNRFAHVDVALAVAHDLCIDARSFDPPVEGRSPWAELDVDQFVKTLKENY